MKNPHPLFRNSLRKRSGEFRFRTFSIKSDAYFSEAISMTKRYFTSLLASLSKAWLIC
jgi:hypothetical protein